jgi:hypothetical protein
MSAREGSSPVVGDPAGLSAVAEQVAARVFRTDLDQPGFALLDLGVSLTPHAFRSFLAGLAGALGEHYRRRFGRQLVPVSVSRFDQQASTRAHRDGGPDESVLVLGYEPTAVASQVCLLDYTRCAVDRGLTPREFLHRFNPAFGDGRKMLQAYTTPVDAFRADRYQVLVINNSVSDYGDRHRGMLGVLHQAVMPSADPAQSRWINSLMLAAADPGAPAGLSADEVRAFVDAAAAAAR